MMKHGIKSSKIIDGEWWDTTYCGITCQRSHTEDGTGMAMPDECQECADAKAEEDEG